MAMNVRLDGASVGRGALAHILLVVPTAIIVAIATRGDAFTTSNLWVVETAVILVAPVVAGSIAARGHPRDSLTHGAAASALGYAGVVIIGGVKRVFDGRGFYSASAIVLILLLLCITVTLGMTGGYLTFRRELRAGRQANER